jgi:hypothetical protein
MMIIRGLEEIGRRPVVYSSMSTEIEVAMLDLP